MTDHPGEPTRDILNGVPTWWMDAPGPFAGSLMFRVGRADETLATGGVTHLVEHLALFSLGQQFYDFNAFVNQSRTVFWAYGTEEQVTTYLQSVCRGLQSLPAERFDVERQVLRTEAASRPVGTHSQLWCERFGATGYGLMDYPEWGLRTLTAQEVQDWADVRFTAGNAVLWFTGSPPADLDLDLPSGARFAPIPPSPRRGFATPSHYARGEAAVAFSALLPRDDASALAMGALQRRAHARLRIDLGSSYSVGWVWNPLTAEQAYAWLSADGAYEHGTEIAQELSDVIETLLRDGVEQEEVREYVEASLRDLDNPLGAGARLDGLAWGELLGRRAASTEELKGELAALAPEDVAVAIRNMVETSQLVIPKEAAPPSGSFAQPVPRSISTEVAGPVLVKRDGSVSGVALGEDGITLRDDDGPVSVRWTDCVGVFVTRKGEHSFVDDSGSWISVDPWYFVEGAQLLDAVGSYVDARLVINVDDDDRWRRLWDLADEGDIDRSKHWRNLVEVRTALGDGEQPLVACEAKHQGNGVLLLTSDRILHISQRRPKARRILYWTLDKLYRAWPEQRVLGGGTLVVGFKDTRNVLRVEGIRPTQRLRDVADLTQAAIAMPVAPRGVDRDPR